MSDKEYFENKAIELLREHFGMQHFINLDKPDLQNTTDNIGVEVRRAIDTEDGKREGYVNANFTSQKTLEEKEEQLKRRKVKGKVVDLGFAHVLIPETYGNSSYIKEGYQKIVDSFFDKLSKLNGGGYTHFSTNALFLFCEHANEQWEIGMITDNINTDIRTKTNEADTMFDVVFFDTSQHLHKVEYDKTEKKYKVSVTKDKIIVPVEKISSLGKITVALSKTKLKKLKKSKSAKNIQKIKRKMKRVYTRPNND